MPWSDDIGSLRFWRETVAKEWDEVIPSSRGGDGQGGLCVTQARGFECYFNYCFSPTASR